MTSHLVPGGVPGGTQWKRPSANVSFPTTTPPRVTPDTIIIGAAAPNIEKGHPTLDGWFLSDFYAFNYLLKGLGSRQVWLTAADPHKLIQSGQHTDRFMHGNPYQTRKVVLDKHLLQAQEYTPVTIVRSAEMIERFLKEVRTASQEAVSKGVPLLLLIFCHGKGNWEFLLDCGKANRGLSVTRVKEAVATGCNVTLYSTACYSGGWVVRDLSKPEHSPINATMLAAADPKHTSNAWQDSPSIGRACGSVFASTVIKSLTSSASPLQPILPAGVEQLEPESDNPTQTQTYNAFCHSVLNICATQVTTLHGNEAFTFSAQDDQWDWSWTRRTGIPLSHFQKRWDALPDVPFNTRNLLLTHKKTYSDPDPRNASFSGSAGPSQTGGGDISEEFVKNLTKNRTAAMARTFLETCPGDWDSGFGPIARGCLRAAANHQKVIDPDVDVAAMMAFRWEVSLLADYIVQHFNLKAPNGETCLMWDRGKWQAEGFKTIPNYDKRYSAVWSALQNANIEPEPATIQGYPFVRFSEYLTVAVVALDLSGPDTMSLASKIGDFMEEFRKFQETRSMTTATRDRGVIRKARDFFKVMGQKFSSLDI
ncbi:hypothetical protein GCG54_00000495 [Colletotrichum gloeosporioides]|uniref:Uncharacterized protein n=1 Tax=Colletotrichum gloeosporioides TaxID=474922 RepID=A0A8H4CHT9_COLGL|nr:uncharacterized protein GCG54_00000495 [Colletotrichum gloeosporioides]KAF3804146.1 hypothetical protein GCG54_00000495 [Colletotrichum gloeosporioides]